MTIRRGHRWYEVLAPYSYTDDLFYGMGPMYEAKHVLFVRTDSAPRAKVLAVRAWRRRFATRSLDRPDFMRDSGNPFAGITAHRVEAST